MGLISNRNHRLELWLMCVFRLDLTPSQAETVADDKCPEIGNTIAAAPHGDLTLFPCLLGG